MHVTIFWESQMINLSNSVLYVMFNLKWLLLNFSYIYTYKITVLDENLVL